MYLEILTLEVSIWELTHTSGVYPVVRNQGPKALVNDANLFKIIERIMEGIYIIHECVLYYKLPITVGLWFMVFNGTFNNISVTCISWRSVLLVQETGQNHRPVVRH